MQRHSARQRSGDTSLVRTVVSTVCTGRYVVLNVRGENRLRLLELGLVPGARLDVLRTPWGTILQMLGHSYAVDTDTLPNIELHDTRRTQ